MVVGKVVVDGMRSIDYSVSGMTQLSEQDTMIMLNMEIGNYGYLIESRLCLPWLNT